VFSRVFSDAEGVEWEVYDDSRSSIARALDWDHLPQGPRPGLIFTSRRGSRRISPAPPGWQTLNDDELRALCDRAAAGY
jgi:hypothetical protein